VGFSIPSFLAPVPVPVTALGIPSDAALWEGTPLAERQRQHAQTAGLSWGDSADVISLSEGACATDELLKRFWKESDAVDGDVVGLVDGPMRQWAEGPFGPAFLVRWRGPGERTPARAAAARKISLFIEGKTFNIPLAQNGDATLVNDPARLIGVHHWSGLLWANLLGLADTLRIALLGNHWPGVIGRVLWGALKARSQDPWQVAGALNRRGKGVRIHPTAVVEGCQLGDRVEVGPGAVLRGCMIGADSRIEPQSVVAFSVLGEKVVVQRQGFVMFSVLHAGASVGGSLQLGVLGPEASLKRGAYLLDQSLVPPVFVMQGDQRWPAPLGMIGVGLGARSVVGTGVQVAAGRTLPPDIQLVPSGDSLLRSIAPEARGLLEVKEGKLHPLVRR